MRHAHRVALVTGGSRGLGLLIARELGRLGTRVTIVVRCECAGARTLVLQSHHVEHLSLRRIFQSDWMRSASSTTSLRVMDDWTVVDAAFAIQTGLAPFVGRAPQRPPRIIDAANAPGASTPTIRRVGTIYAPRVGGSLT